MKRSDFLKGLGLVSAGSLIPFQSMADNKPTVCSEIPTETDGPFPLDLTTNNAATYFRSDIRESKTGVKLNLTIKVFGIGNCEVMPNTRVNIWHCDAGGSYSGYSTTVGNTTNTVGETWLRGYQLTDANGEVNFTTIFPGWYNGRVCHIHFQVYQAGSNNKISQMGFDDTTKNDIYAANTGLYTKGSDPMTMASDSIFNSGGNSSLQLCTLTQVSSNEYNGYIEVGVLGSGTTDIDDIIPGTGGILNVGQNYPNPYSGSTTIPFTIVKQSDLNLGIYDLNGRLLKSIMKEALTPGDHTITINTNEIGLPTATYLYRVQISNQHGVFQQAKIMTAVK